MAGVSAPSDPLKELLSDFARMVHPLKRDNVSLVPGQKTPLLMFGYIQFPRWNELGQLVAADDDLAKLFPASGSTKDVFVYRSVGGIGPVTPTNVAGTICEAAWLAWQQKSNAIPEADQFVAEVCDMLDRLRKAARGDRIMMPVKVGLAGAKLPDGRSEIVLPWCRIRPADQRDADVMALVEDTGEIQTTDANGNTVAVSYRGDLVAEFELPYVIRTADRFFGAGQAEQDPWPAELNATRDERRAGIKCVDCVRAGFTLAEVVANGSLATTWRCEVDPLDGLGCSIGWSDSRRSRIFPHQLSEDEVDRWTEWMKRSWQFYDQIPISVTRILRAVSEVKPRPEDTLIDAIIVWENIFGAPQEATLRITFSMARILEDDPAKRRDRWKEFKDIYTLRSDIVHGNERTEKVTPTEMFDAANRAVPISVKLLRTVMVSHPTLLTDCKNGAERSAVVLLS